MNWATRRRMLLAPSDVGGATDTGNPGGAGGDGEASSAGADAGQGGGDKGASPPPGGDGGQTDDKSGARPRSSIMDYAPKDPPKDGEAGSWAPPDGVEIPDHLRGSSAEDTIAKLAKAYNGARTDLATKRRADGVLEGEVPKDIDGYTFDEPENKDDPIYQDLTSEESKPIVDAWRKAALELGIPNKAFAQFLQKGMANMAEQGLQAFPDPDEVAGINGEREWEALVAEVGDRGANQILHQMNTYGQQLAQRGILQSEDDVQEWGQMIGTAKAARIMSRILSAEFGEKPIPPGEGAAGAPTQEEAYAAHREAMKMPPGRDREEAVERAEEMIRKALAKNSTPGQIRSRVL